MGRFWAGEPVSNGSSCNKRVDLVEIAATHSQRMGLVHRNQRRRWWPGPVSLPNNRAATDRDDHQNSEPEPHKRLGPAPAALVVRIPIMRFRRGMIGLLLVERHRVLFIRGLRWSAQSTFTVGQAERIPGERVILRLCSGEEPASQIRVNPGRVILTARTSDP